MVLPLPLRVFIGLLASSHQVLRRFTIGTGVYSMRFCGDYGYLITGGYSPEPLLWVLNGGAKCDPFQLLDEDRPHSGALVGVEVVEGTPQVR